MRTVKSSSRRNHSSWSGVRTLRGDSRSACLMSEAEGERASRRSGRGGPGERYAPGDELLWGELYRIEGRVKGGVALAAGRGRCDRLHYCSRGMKGPADADPPCVEPRLTPERLRWSCGR